jgi:hypothetical protein
MKEGFKKHKWLIYWVIFTLIISLFVFMALFFEHKSWIGNVLQTIGTIAGIYLTLVIFIYSKEDSEKQFKEHLEYLQQLNYAHIEALEKNTKQQISTLQELNARQIDVLQNSTTLQIKTWQELILKQIEALQSGTNQQIKTLQDLTEKQIEALHKTTYEEISAFEKQNRDITSKLSDNSILLAEILGRELEKSIGDYNTALIREEAKYTDLSGFKLLRTKEEKERQLNNQWQKIEQIRRGCEYLVNKYNQIRNFLGFGNKGLNH